MMTTDISETIGICSELTIEYETHKKRKSLKLCQASAFALLVALQLRSV